MSVRERKIVLALVFVGFLIFDTKISARPLGDEEKTRLYESIIRPIDANMTIDVSFIEEVVTNPEAVKKIHQVTIEETRKLREQAKDDSITLVSVNIPSPDGSEMRLSQKRIRIGSGLRMRVDTTIFANKEKTETHYEATTINSLFDVNAPSYRIDHKLKQVIINNWRWSGRKVLRFGKVDEAILMDIVRLCNPKWRTKPSKNKDFSYKGAGNVDVEVVDEIECIDLESGKPKYTISLDPNDWQICRRIVRYDDKSGLASKIVEYKQFAKAKGSGELFPRLVIRRYFGKEGKEEKVKTINVTDVVIGLPISEDIFKLDVPTDYTIVDNRSSALSSVK